MATIRVFTLPDCPYCDDAKAWLDEHGCDYEELDVSEDVEALREWRKLSGGAGVPLIAHGNDVMVGFSAERLARMVDGCDHTSPVDEEAVGAEAG